MRKFQAYEACSSTSPDYDSKSGSRNKKKNAKKTNRYLKANNQADDSPREARPPEGGVKPHLGRFQGRARSAQPNRGRAPP